jgi:subtilisin family serine protease
MDPALQELMDEGAAGDEVAVIIRLADETRVPDGVRVISRFRHIVTARLQRSDIKRTWESALVVSLKAARPVAVALSYDLEDDGGAREDFFDAPATARPAALREDGTGVIMAVCDWGLDFTHPNFRNADGTTRLIGFWDQNGRGGTSPQPFGYGRYHSRDEINAALRRADPFAALGYDLHRSDRGGHGTHGTHVTDIAAGNRRAPGSKAGIAPGADLLFVEPTSLSMGHLADFGDSVCLLEALDFIRKTAAGRPCSINLSAGKTGGEHRGTNPFEQAVDAMLTSQDNLALVQSAGNYGSSNMHSHGRVGPAKTLTLKWIINQRDRTPNELEIWYNGHDVFDVTLISPQGQRFSAGLGDRARIQSGSTHWGNFYHRLLEPNSQLNHVDIFLRPSAPAGIWSVEIIGREIIDGRFHAWIERDAGGVHQSHFAPENATPDYTTNTICNGLRAIAVGAYDATKPDRPPTIFSSRGPTADERLKPEIAAPGYRIRAARSVPKGGWAPGQSMLTTKSGTSMASPHVAGTVALMYQAAGRPLSIGEVRRVLIGTADHPGDGGSSNRLGYGYLNIEAAVAAVRGSVAEQRRPAPRRMNPYQDAYETDEREIAGSFESDPAFESSTPSPNIQRFGSRQQMFDSLARGQADFGGEVVLEDVAEHSPWEVVARPRAAISLSDVREGDVVIRRALGEGRLTSTLVVGEHIGADQVFGPDGLVRRDTLVLRAHRATPTSTTESDETDESSDYGCGPRHAEAEFHEDLAPRFEANDEAEGTWAVEGTCEADAGACVALENDAPNDRDEALEQLEYDAENDNAPIEAAAAAIHTFELSTYRTMDITVNEQPIRTRNATATAPPRFAITPGQRFRTLAELDTHLTTGLRVRTSPTEALDITQGRAMIDTGHFQVDPGNPAQFQVRIRGLVCHPSSAAGSNRLPPGTGRLPVAILVHGQHAAMKFALAPTAGPRRTVGGLTLVPARASVNHEVFSYRGYRYLQEHLANLGIVSLSIDTNAANQTGSFIRFRADLVLEALDHLRTLDATSGSPFHNRLDFDKVALIGHSRGGDAVVMAAELNLARPAATKYGLRAVIALAPTDFSGVADPKDRLRMRTNRAASFLCVYGSHDGDVSGGFDPKDRSQGWGFTGTGFRHYDRASTQRAMVFIHGATHNRFNTVWIDPALHIPGTFHHKTALAQADDTDDALTVAPALPPSSTLPVVPGQRDARVLSSTAHQTLAREYIGGWLAWWLNGQHAEQRRFNGGQPNSVGAPIGLQWRFGRALRTIDIFDDTNPASNTLGGAVTSPGFVNERLVELSNPANVPHHDRVLAATRARGPNRVYSTEIPAAQRDWSQFNALSFRLSKHFPDVTTSAAIAVASFPPNLQVTLFDGRVRASVDQSVIAPLNPRTVRPYWRKKGTANLTKVHMQTWQIPLSNFTASGLSLNSIESVELTFGAGVSEPIHLDTLSVVRL